VTGKFDSSLRPGGAHHFLAQLTGQWAGTARTWFEPDELADASPVNGCIRPVLGGGFVLHEYESSLEGAAFSGIALCGYDLAEGRFVTAWVDSFHNGTALMCSTGPAGGWPGACSVLGSYPDGAGGPRWGWRTELELASPDRLRLRHYNVPPGGAEALAVEFDYRRCA
jgi:hypothetical protein